MQPDPLKEMGPGFDGAAEISTKGDICLSGCFDGRILSVSHAARVGPTAGEPAHAVLGRSLRVFSEMDPREVRKTRTTKWMSKHLERLFDPTIN